MKKSAVPDAWDDDWETQADSIVNDVAEHDQGGGASLRPTSTLTKAERITQHEEANRRMWETADSTPQTFHYLEASSSVPLTTGFKPQVKVLSRKPIIAKRDPITGMSQLSMDDEEPEKDKKLPTPEEIRAKQKRDLEEKQRRYDEARAKIFGESNPSSRGSSPGTVTPPRLDSRHSGQGRGRGGRGGSQRNANNNNISSANEGSWQTDVRRTTTQPPSGRELYDPNFSPRPDSASQRRGAGAESDGSGRGTPLRDDNSQFQPPSQQPQAAIRSPRGPDGSGRGGFGFAQRGGKES